MKRFIYLLSGTELPESLLHRTLFGYRLIAAAALFAGHGLPKIVNFTDEMQHIPDPFNLGSATVLYFAILADVICPVLIAMGIFSRLVTLPVLATTLTGLLIVHWDDPWAAKDIPLIYTIVFGSLLFFGPGKYSFDNLWFGNRNFRSSGT